MPSVRKLCAGKRKKYSNGCFATRTLTDRDSAAMQVNNKPATEEFHLRHLDVVEAIDHFRQVERENPAVFRRERRAGGDFEADQQLSGILYRENRDTVALRKVVEENGHEVAERASQPFLISVKKG